MQVKKEIEVETDITPKKSCMDLRTRSVCEKTLYRARLVCACTTKWSTTTKDKVNLYAT